VNSSGLAFPCASALLIPHLLSQQPMRDQSSDHDLSWLSLLVLRLLLLLLFFLPGFENEMKQYFDSEINCSLVGWRNRNSMFDNNCRLISISAWLAFAEDQECHCDNPITWSA
jgi:hypothetical protein